MTSLGQTTEAVLGNLPDAALQGEPQPSVSWNPSVVPGTPKGTTGVRSEDSIGEFPFGSATASEGLTISCLS